MNTIGSPRSGRPFFATVDSWRVIPCIAGPEAIDVWCAAGGTCSPPAGERPPTLLPAQLMPLRARRASPSRTDEPELSAVHLHRIRIATISSHGTEPRELPKIWLPALQDVLTDRSRLLRIRAALRGSRWAGTTEGVAHAPVRRLEECQKASYSQPSLRTWGSAFSNA
jgi:hypothetical protein